MSVQARSDNTNLPFVLHGLAVSVSNGILLQNAGRTADLKFGTVMAKSASTGKWAPLSDLASTTGSALPQGFYVGPDIPFADIVAGDVTDLSIIVNDAIVDIQQLVLENSLTLDSIIDTGTVNARTVRDQLAFRGLIAEETTYISEFSAPSA